MRIFTTLMLGAAALVLAAVPIQAQNAAPAVAPPGAETPARQPPLQATARSAPADPEDTNAPPTTDAPALADVAATPADGTVNTASFTPASGVAAVQEAKNNEAGVTAIDAASTGDPDDSNSIAATVNDESISDYEVRQRMALYIATSGLTQLTAEQKKRIRGQILDQLEVEKVQLQEAVKKKITVSPVEVDRRINAMMAENRFTIQQLRATLANAGASEDALRAQITASIAWQKAVQDEYGDRINITPEMINAEMARFAEGANKAHFHVLEIFLPVDNPEQDAKVKKDTDEILAQLKQGAPFPMVARQFSQHPTAASGGDMGWINEGQLAPELDAALVKMEPGSISTAIRAAGGYYILALRERQEAIGTKIAEAPKGPTGPAGTLPLARLLLPLSPRAPKPEVEEVIKVATQIRERITSCSQLEQLHQKMKGTVYMDLGSARLDELSPQIQASMKDSRPGEVAMPFQSEAGVEIIARCDKRVQVQTVYTMPTRKDVEDQLFQSQIAALARRYLRDLKRNANIQVRDDSKPDALIR